MEGLLALCQSTLKPDNVTEQEVFRKVLRLYERASKSYLESEELKIRVELVTKQVKAQPKRMWVITRDLFNELKAYKEEKPPRKSAKSAAATVTNGDNNTHDHTTSAASATEPSTSDDGRSVKKVSERQLARLEALLAQHCKEIEKLESKELSLDDLESEDNSYLIAERLKKRAAKIFKRLCTLKQRSMSMGGTREKRFKYSGSRYHELNVHIQRFINKHSFEERMPDCADIKRIVKLCNGKYNYSLSSRRIDELAKDVFSEVGTRLSSIRKRDFLDDFGPATANKVLKQADDPAMLSAALREKLKKNHKVGERNIDQLLQQYTNKQETEEENKRDQRKQETDSVQIEAANGDETKDSDQSELDSSSSDEEEEVTEGTATTEQGDSGLSNPVLSLDSLNGAEPSADDNTPSTSGYIAPTSPASSTHEQKEMEEEEREDDTDSTTSSDDSDSVTELSGLSHSEDNDDSDTEHTPTQTNPKSPPISPPSDHNSRSETPPQLDSAHSPPLRIQEVVGTPPGTSPLKIEQVEGIYSDSSAPKQKRVERKRSDSPPLKIGRVEGEVIMLSDSD